MLGSFLLVGIFGCTQNEESKHLIQRLVWFEIQITPFTYRFAIIPEQPIVIGYEGDEVNDGATMLIRYDHVPEVYEKTVEEVARLVKESGALTLKPIKPNLAFSEDLMEQHAVHIRIAFADDKRWASVYDLDKLPMEIETLIEDTRNYAMTVMKDHTKDNIGGELAETYLDPKLNVTQKESPEVIVKLVVHLSGAITANGQEVSLVELGAILDDLANSTGEVWYYRESPQEEPTESTIMIIEQVLDAIAQRDLPIRLQTEQY